MLSLPAPTSVLRSLLLALLFLGLGADARAQLPLQYGVLGGATFASQSPGADGRTGFNVGLFVDYAALPYLALSLEGAYVEKGQTFEGELLEVDGTVLDNGTFTFALDYASFTLAARPSVPLGPSGASVYAVAGPRLDVLAREKLLFDGPEESVRLSVSEHEKTALGYDVGVGFRLGTLLPVPILAEVRYAGDLSDAFTGTTRDMTRNQAVLLRIGVML